MPRPFQARLLPLAGLALVAGLLLPGLDPLAAQEETTPDRSNPRASVHGYLEATRAGNNALAARYLNLARLRPEQREAQGARLAWQLKVVLDQTLWVDWASLSDQPAGERDDGQPADVESVGPITTDPPVDLLLQRVDSAEGAVWLIHSRTVAQIPRLYGRFGYGRLGEWLPEPLLTLQLADLQLWQWLGLALAGLIAYGLALALGLLVLRALQGVAARTHTGLDDRLGPAIASPLSVTLAVALFYPLTLALALAIPARAAVGRLCQVLLITGVTWLLIRLVDLAATAVQERLQARGDAAAATVVPMARRVGKLFLAAIAALSALQNLGFNITGLIAGLGIGGLAVALAAQKLFEDLFGGISLIADRPIQVGDFGRFGPHLGTVEAIGLRSTRVRTLDRTVVSLRNAEFASLPLENFGRRDRIRFFTVLGVRYETTADQLRFLLIEIRRLLLSHARVTSDPARIRFVGFGAHSLDLEIFAYINTSDFNEYLAIQEDLLLRIMEIVEASGTGFAFPSQTLYLGRDSGLDDARSRAAEQQVREQRQAGRLRLPDVPPEQVAELAGSLPYPPPGSATARLGG